MTRDRGRTIPRSFGRQLIGGMLAMSRPVPLANAERWVELAPLRRLVARCRPRPNWLAIVLKAYALVAIRNPRLRWTYVSWPWPRYFEHNDNRASLVCSRSIGGEETLLGLILDQPEKMTIAEIDRTITEARYRPLEEVVSFRRQLRAARWPAPIRWLTRLLAMKCAVKLRSQYLGTFAMSVMANMGMGTLTTLSPLTSMIHYTPFDDDGRMTLRLAYDQRVLDETAAAETLAELEKTLLTEIRAELEQMAGHRDEPSRAA